MYRQKIGELVYTIAIDHIENTGYFIEFEILSQDAIEKEQIQRAFDTFVDLFGDFDLQEENMPYRDIVRPLDNNRSETK
jgi:adenylate cyclase class IV